MLFRNRQDKEDTIKIMKAIQRSPNKLKGECLFLQCRSRLLTPKRRRDFFGKAFPDAFSPMVPFCSGLKRWGRTASLTVECALSLPLFFFAMVTMISFMDLYMVETVQLTRLCQLAKTTAAVTYTPSTGGIEDITLPAVYSFQPVSGIFPLRSVYRVNAVKVRRWNGKLHVANAAAREAEKMVYVTETGTVFHRSLGCSYLNLSVTHISSVQLASQRNRYGEKYEPCERCAASGIPAALVYITAKGDRYHNSSSCSGLKRSVRMIKESEAAGLPPCSRCG